MDLDEKELNLLSALVALGQANPQNAQIGNLIFGKFMDSVTPKQTEQQKIKDLLAQGYANRVASGEGDTEEALGFLESLTQDEDTAPLTSLRNKMGEKSAKAYEIGDVPEDMKDQAIANKYQELYNKAVTKGDYSQLDEFKSKYPDYNFDVDEEGTVSAKQKEWGLTAKLATLFGGEEEGRKAQTREDLKNAINDFYGSKHGLFGQAVSGWESMQGFPSVNTDEGKAFLKKKGITEDVLKRLGDNRYEYQNIKL